MRVHRQRALPVAQRIVDEWLHGGFEGPEDVYPSLAREIAIALARRDAEIARLRVELDARSAGELPKGAANCP